MPTPEANTATTDHGCGDLYLTGGRIEAVSCHNVHTGSIELLYGSVCTGLISSCDGILLCRLINSGCCYIDEVLIIDCNVVVLCRYELVAYSRLRSDLSPESVPSRDSNLLSTDIAVEVAHIAHYDDTFVACRGYNEETAVAVNSDSNGSVDSVRIKESTGRLEYGLYKGTVELEDNDSRVLCIASVDVILVYEETADTCKAIGNALLVIKVLNGKQVLIIFIKHVDAVCLGVGNVDLIIVSDSNVSRSAEIKIATHIRCVYNYVGSICIRRVEHEARG